MSYDIELNQPSPERNLSGFQRFTQALKKSFSGRTSSALPPTLRDAKQGPFQPSELDVAKLGEFEQFVAGVVPRLPMKAGNEGSPSVLIEFSRDKDRTFKVLCSSSSYTKQLRKALSPRTIPPSIAKNYNVEVLFVESPRPL